MNPSDYTSKKWIGRWEDRYAYFLIIKNYQKEWCNSVQEALQKRLHALLKIWKAEVLVLNEEQARIFHLCQS